MTPPLRVGIVTEGRGEVPAFPPLYPSLQALVAPSRQVQFLNPAFAPADPCAPPVVIAKACKPRVDALHARGAELVFVTLDRECITETAIQRGEAIGQQLAAMCAGETVVLIKDRAVENWLIADPGAFDRSRALFPDAARVRYPQGRADSQDAIALIKAAIKGGRYDKMRHPTKIWERSDCAVMEVNSRSFCRLVAEIRRHH